MKKLIVLSLALIFAFQLTNAQEKQHSDLKWYTDFEQAKKIAKKEHKPILMLFTGSDWCPPCRAMHNELFVNKDFIDISKKVVLVLVDFPKRKPISAEQKEHNYKLSRKFHQGGVPTFVAVTPDEKILGKMSGYRYGAPQRDIDFFKQMIEKFNTK